MLHLDNADNPPTAHAHRDRRAERRTRAGGTPLAGGRPAPSRLLLRLVKAGEHAIAPEQRRARERRRRAVERHHGRFTGIYPSGYLEKLRSEWPD